MKIFVADDKFADVIAALEARGDWQRHAHLSFPRPALRWTNYARVQWSRVKPEQLVNHVHRAVLFSQKDQLAALLATYQANYAVQGDAEAVVDTFYPRTFDLRRPEAWKELRNWAVYSEAVKELKRFQRSRQGEKKAVDCAVAFLQAALQADSFFTRPRTRTETVPLPRAEAVDVDAVEWRPLSSRWTTDVSESEEHPQVTQTPVDPDGVATLLQQLAVEDPQLSTISDEEDAGGCVWICKPSNLSQGRGIAMVRSLAELTATIGLEDHEEDAKWVVQKYVERPLLLQRGRKFDIRQWVLVTALPPSSRVFWYQDCYLRFCSRPFSLSSPAAWEQDKFAHLSNYSVQKDFVPDEDRVQGQEAPLFEAMWSSERFRDSLRIEYGTDVWTDVVLPRMQSVASHTLRAVLPELRMVGKGFEWLGFDFLLDQDLQVWLLEVNVSPDVSHSTPVTADMVPRATTDALSLVLDPPDQVSPANRWLPMPL